MSISKSGRFEVPPHPLPTSMLTAVDTTQCFTKILTRNFTFSQQSRNQFVLITSFFLSRDCKFLHKECAFHERLKGKRWRHPSANWQLLQIFTFRDIASQAWVVYKQLLLVLCDSINDHFRSCFVFRFKSVLQQPCIRSWAKKWLQSGCSFKQ